MKGLNDCLYEIEKWSKNKKLIDTSELLKYLIKQGFDDTTAREGIYHMLGVDAEAK